MGPSIDQVDPTAQAAKDVQGSAVPFLQDLFQNPSQNPLSSPLATQANLGISQFLNQPAPEVQVFNDLRNRLTGMANSGTQVTEAALPVFQRTLQSSLGALSNQAPGRFSTAFENQGIDLTSRALQDFNLFAEQARQRDVQNQLASASLLGQLAGSAGEAPFQRLLGAQQAALGSQDQTLRLLLGGLGFAAPQPKDTVVGDSPFKQLTEAGLAAFMAAGGGGG